jgi:ubiquinone/menaquinone biosynthesis C-methylase UbiE
MTERIKPVNEGGKPVNPAEHLDQKKQERAARDKWDERYLEKESYVTEGPVPAVEEFFKKYEKELKGGKVLDIGSGPGRNLTYIARQGFDTYGIDNSEASLKLLKERLKKEGLAAHFAQASFYDLPFEDNKFRAAISNNVFQHNDWEGAEKSFSEAARVLEPGGLFMVSIRSTSRALPEMRTDVPDKGVTFIPKEGSKAGIMLHHYSLEEVEELAEKSGLEILEKREVIKMKKKGKEGEEAEIGEGEEVPEEEKEQRGHWVLTLRKKEERA